MLRTLSWLAAASCVVWLSSAAALGLGEIDVKSRLNQRFLATIPVTSVSPEEAETLIISLASNVDFERAGIERTEYLSSLRFSVNTEGGNPRIVVSSPLSAREPYLSFLINVRSRTGTSLREYTVLLDPPEVVEPPKPAVSKPAPPVAPGAFYETAEEQARREAGIPPPAPPKPSAAVVAPPVAAAPVTPPPAAAPPVAPAEPEFTPPAATAAAVDRYGPVQAKETLWSIASKLRPDASVTMDQVLLSLYTANPKAFDGFQGLQKGAVLKVPSADEMRAVSPAAARARVAELRGTPRVVAPAAVLPPPEPVVPPPAAAVPPPKPVVKPAPAAAAPAPAPQPVDKPLLPPVPAAKPMPPIPVPDKKPEPAPMPAPAPAAVVPPPAPAEAVPAEPATEQPLIPDQPLIEEKPQPAEVVRPAAELEEEIGSDNSGLYLWLVVGLALLGAGGFLGWRFWKNQQGQGSQPQGFTPSSVLRRKAAANPEPSWTPPPDDPEPQLASAPAMPATSTTQIFDATSETPANRLSSTLTMSTGQGFGASATQSMDTAMTRTAQSPAERVDFDVTSQFNNETMSINLDANDPVSEADFHLAYGLYDEAALLLKQAAEKDPGRTDIRVKLAETYFAASRPGEFEQVAQSLQGQLPEGEWQKLALMGQQLNPDSALFAGAGDAVLGSDIDLAFDEPSEPAAASSALHESTIALQLDMPSEPVQFSAPSAPATDLGALDFKLEELELPKLDEPKIDIPAPAKSGGGGLDFKLEELSLQTSPGTAEVAVAKSQKIDFADSMQTISMSTAGAPDDMRLDDFDLNDASSAISTGDEAGTKLDLARAYADMGDNDMARTLLKEVAQQGNAEQQREAQTLMSRLA